jgi:hypothetical protein
MAGNSNGIHVDLTSEFGDLCLNLIECVEHTSDIFDAFNSAGATERTTETT